MYQVTIHFNDGRAPIELLAEDAGIEPEGSPQEDGLQKYTYAARDGDRAPVYLDPCRVAAVVSAPASVPGKTESRSISLSTKPAKSPNRREIFVSEAPETVPEGIEIVGGEEEPLAVGREEHGQPGRGHRGGTRTPSGASASIPRSRELEREVLMFLSRFVSADVKQLMSRYPIRSNLSDRSHLPLAAERFFDSEDRACDQLELMRREGTVAADARYFRSVPETVYRITGKGEEAVSMIHLPAVSVCYLAHGFDYYAKMAGLYQSMVDSLDGRAEWITGRELMSEELRTNWEEKLGRGLPAAAPGAHEAWPATPEGVLFARDSGVVAAVGLELTHVSRSRLSAYESILESYSEDPNIDRVYLFFAHEKARHRVEELARRYRQDDFFVFRDYPVEKPPDVSVRSVRRSGGVHRVWPSR